MLWAVTAHAQRAPGSALFNRYPFDKWAEENAKPQLRWQARVEPARLTPHQRLAAEIRITLDGSELKNRQQTPIVSFVRIEDSQGHRYQISTQGFAAPLQNGVQYDRMTHSVQVFFLPGDYVVSLAICDGKTLEHSFARQKFHVAPLKSDPLPLAWRDLPSVEFVPDGGIPYSWYLPQLRTMIRLPVANEKPVRVELMVNTTPSNLSSLNLYRANMQVVVPSMKVLMGIDPAAGSVGLSIVDLNRRTLSYQQPELRIANVGRGPGSGTNRSEWSRLRPVLNDFSTAQVEAETLLGQSKMLNYFSEEVTRILGDDDRRRVLIVLSAPVYFSHQEKPPIPDLPPDPNRRIFYIQYSPPFRVLSPGLALRIPPPTYAQYSFADDLARLLKPRHARIFRVTRAEEFRKALGEILTGIAAM